MKIGFVIPARLKSTRLKKKILMKLGDQSALEWAIDRAKSSYSIDEVVVATTNLKTDSEISKICIEKGIRYFQGDPDDVLMRLKDTAQYFEFDYIINITPDNTLFSTYLIDLMVSKIKEDLTVDFLHFKDAMLGTGLYGIKKEALKTICEFKDVVDTEIWGPLFHRDYFNIKTIEIPNFLKGNYRLTMDTEEDFLMLSKIYDGLKIQDGKIIELNTIINYLDSNPEIVSLNEGVEQNFAPQEIIDDINNRFIDNESKFLKIKRKHYKGE